MYSIGEFSKIGSVSTKTLRYYDEIGLLRPAYVDAETHYRYYAEEQVDQILLISELKTYDLRLEQIKAILESRDRSLLEYFLRQRIQFLDGQIQASIALRQCIEKKVQEIQSGGTNMEQNLVVEMKEFEPVWVMGRRATIDMTQYAAVIGSVFEAIFQNNLQPAGPVMTFYMDPEFDQEHADIEVCVPVMRQVSGEHGKECQALASLETQEEAGISDGLENIPGVKLLNPGLCAYCIHVGPYSKLGKAYAAVMKWMEENRYQISYAPFDVYVSDPQKVKNPEELVTQVWFPIKK